MGDSDEYSRFSPERSDADSEDEPFQSRNVRRQARRMVESDSESDDNASEADDTPIADHSIAVADMTAYRDSSSSSELDQSSASANKSSADSEIIPESEEYDSTDDENANEISLARVDERADQIDRMMERKQHRRSTRFFAPSSSDEENEEVANSVNEDKDDSADEGEVTNGTANRSSPSVHEQSSSFGLNATGSDNSAEEHSGSGNSAEEHSGVGQDEQNKRHRSMMVNESITTRTPDAKKRLTNASTSTPSRSHNGSASFHMEAGSNSNSLDSDASLEIVTKNSSIIDLESSSENVVETHGHVSSISFGEAAASTPGNAKPLVQPKLSFGKQAPNDTADLAKLKEEQRHYEELYERFKNSLPDNGANMLNKIQAVKAKIIARERKQSVTLIESDDSDVVESDVNDPTYEEPASVKRWSNTKVQSVNDDWRDAINKIQPKHTGDKGMETHNLQKALTLERIAKLHKAMEQCPQEDELARHPENLKIELMKHQLHALRWMHWRETQKPKGGILADDMGLGKTLTTIALVLDTKYGDPQYAADKNETAASDAEDEDDDDGGDGVAQGRKGYTYEGGTLIVCPASLMNQWKHEIDNRVKRNKLLVYVHHGNKRKTSMRSVCQFDVVITTYGIAASEYEADDVLFRIKWERVVLDEAHQIRNHTTSMSKACCALRAHVRWALTGTPIQNKHMDVYTMLKFLRVRPFDDLSLFKKWIDVKTGDGMKRLHNILKPLILRRTKAELQIAGELQALPKKNFSIELIDLKPDEANIYTKILAYSQTLFAQYMDQNSAKNPGVFSRKTEIPDNVKRMVSEINRKFGRGMDVNVSTILLLILRLRQICCHPGLIENMLSEDLENEMEDEYDMSEMVMVKKMIGLNMSDANDNSKPEDAEDAEDTEDAKDTEDSVKNLLCKSHKIYDFDNPSSKCTKTVKLVQKILRETSDKIVVVSQWTSVLNIVRKFLQDARVHCVELNGKTPIKFRNDIVVNFNNPNTPEKVLLLSLVAGGVGLNLTGANHLLLLDPHWNPQLEAQACDRVYRVGQSKDVHIYKLICNNTIEQHIQGIQDQKLELANNVLTGSNKNVSAKLSIQDMRQLFGM